MTEDQKQKEILQQKELLKQREILKQKYRQKGCQTLSLAEYEALKARKSKKKPFHVPVHLQFIFSTPILIIFCFGIFFIPYIVYVIATGSSAGTTVKEEKKDLSYHDLNVKKDSISKSPASK